MSLNVLSLFDGISCGRVALERAGIDVATYYSSEIKKYAIKVADKNYPQDTCNRLGDITKINGGNLPKIDLLIGGSPCQDLSGAHRIREGVKGTKSGLFFEYMRLKKEVNPEYFLLENVRMKKKDQDVISEHLGCEPFAINSKLVSPQLRHRLYWTNIPNVTKPRDKGIKLNDILINGYADRDKARALLESDSRRLTTPLKMCHRYLNTGFTTLIFKDKAQHDVIKKHFNKHFKGKSAKDIERLAENMDISIYQGVRYMNKRERECCQTMPSGYTDVLSEDEAACVLGDGWTVDIVAHIFKGLKTDVELAL